MGIRPHQHLGNGVKTMIYYAEYLPNGKYIAKGATISASGISAQHGGAIYIGEVDPVTQRHDVESGGPVDLPVRPSPAHHFDYDSSTWVLATDRAWADVRAKRDTLLAASDWVTLRAQETGQQIPIDWLIYRQALRDVTQQSDPMSIEWPVKPD